MPFRADPSIVILFAVAVAGAGVSVAYPFVLQIPSLCGDASRIALTDLATLLGPSSIIALFVGWLAMLVAMMPPVLAQPLNVVWRLTPRKRRVIALSLFIASYLSIWMTLGVILIPAAIATRSLLGGAAFPASLAVALIWSASPLCQVMRNRCHRTRHIGAIGVAADRDCVIFGAIYGLTCAGACWPWMLAATTVGNGHTVAMVVTAVVLFMDRSASANSPKWHMPPFLRSLRLRLRRQPALGRS